ncbi:DUF2274 domain-containing protein [Sphingosinicella rhizophila]|uniref:DUF2274 domain-containing protein n=1 Tax=Sphingosinicella rhizophila TaxID=3050082 RepID=A0ABU3Q5A3_9SPHN|nr:DUF2274 domain-containing protein [Sphingosinicella sp. GR2756]MDT9598591.1 DUF2274 domain-containing protein [Sphingosinicella sp. GR2756]
MADLKLSQLPDRTPVKLTITISPELHRSLIDYAAVYNEAYGQAESLTELVPHMLTAFLSSDRAFAKARERLGKSAK